MKVGKVSMENEEIVDNVVQGINGVVKIVPKKWGGVRSLHLKFSDSLALPIYQALPDVKFKIDGVKESEDVSHSEGEVVEVKEESSGGEGMGRRKKKKGRIHEVLLMDVGVGVDELESEDDNEGKMKTFAEENVGSDDEREGDVGKKGEDDEDEDFDSDDSGINKRKKGKSVKGLQKKVGKVENGAKAFSEKKEKKKSKLGARLKEVSTAKKAKRSKSRV